MLRCYNNQCARLGAVNIPIVLGEDDVSVPDVDDSEDTIEVNRPYLTLDDGVTPCDEVMQALGTTDVLCIKSATGTGKTTIMKSVIDRTLDKNPDAEILGLSVRRSFANNVAPRIGLISYLDIKTRDAIETEKRLMIQLDSLMKVDKTNETRERDLLILDEYTALCAHFLSSTLQSRHRLILDKFRCVLARSKKIVILCADLEQRGLDWLETMIPGRDRCVVVNRYTHTQTKVIFYRHKDMFEKTLQAKIQDGLNVAMASSSKGYVRKQKAYYEDLIGHSRVKDLTADATESEKAEFNRDPGLLKDYQLFMYTPTLTVGVDINFEHFDSMFAYVKPGTVCARDFLQQIARVRNISNGTIHVCVDEVLPTSLRLARRHRLLSSEQIQDAIEERIQFNGTHCMRKLLRARKHLVENTGGTWNYDTGHLDMDPDFVKLLIWFTHESLVSMADYEGELMNRCRAKGFEVCLDYTHVSQEESQALEQEYEGCDMQYYEDVASQHVDWGFDEDHDDIESRDTKMMLEKKRVIQRLQCEESVITAEITKTFCTEKDQEIENFVALAELSHKAPDDWDDGEGEAVEFSMTKVLDRCLKRHTNRHEYACYAYEDPVLLQLYRCRLLFMLMRHVLGLERGILDAGHVTENIVKQRIAGYSLSELKSLCSILTTEFKLATPPVPKARSLIYAIGKCLRRFCGCGLVAQRSQAAGAHVRFKTIDKETRHKYLSMMAHDEKTYTFDVHRVLHRIYDECWLCSQAGLLEDPQAPCRKRRRQL
jgi:hypothetical protein